MQTRWMLYLVEGDTLSLLPGIPRRWMEHGQEICIQNAASYFGAFSLEVESRVDDNIVTTCIECNSKRAPQQACATNNQAAFAASVGTKSHIAQWW